MSKELTKGFGSSALSTDLLDKLNKGIAESRASTVIAGGGEPLLRLLKRGAWVYGVQDDEVQPGSSWAINPLSLMHGWSCWTQHEGNQKNELLGESLAPMTEHKPARPEPVDGFPYNELRTMNLQCMTGDDVGTGVLYKGSSIGGMRAVDGLLAEIQKKLGSGERTFVCPVIQLHVDSYPHQKWGEIMIPIFTIVGWCDMQGNMQGAKQLEPANGIQKPEAAPARKRQRAPVAAAATAPVESVSQSAAAPVTPTPTMGLRRRPVAG